MKYAKNTSWLMGEKILRMFMGLFVGIWVARYLGPEQFGLLSYAQSFVFLFTAIATLGLDGIVVRELVRDGSRRDVLLGTSFALKLVGSLFILPFLWIAVQFTSNDGYTNAIIFITALATIFQSFNVIDFYYQSTVMSKYVALANTVCLMLSSLMKIILIINHAPLIAFAWMAVFDSVVLAVGLVYFYLIKTKHKLMSWRFDFGVAKNLLLQSFPLAIGSLSAFIYMEIDQVMLGLYSNDMQLVGNYAIAVKLSTLWYFIVTSITSSLAPQFTKLYHSDLDLFYERLQKVYDFVVKIAIIIIFAVFIFSDKIIYLLYGDKYMDSTDVLKIYVWSTFFVFLSNVSWLYYINRGLQKIASYRLIVGAVLNILLNIIFIPLYSLKGAAIATVISYAVSSYFMNLAYKETRTNFFIQSKAILNIFRFRTWLFIYYIGK